MDAGVRFAAGADGRRSSAAAGKAVVAAALAGVDPEGAAAVGRVGDWRKGYLGPFRRLVEAGLPKADDWVAIARDGLAELDRQVRFGDGPLTDALAAPGRSLPTVTERGDREPAGFVLPYRGERLTGDGIRRAVDGWVERGLAEPSLAGAVGAVLAHPEWLRCEGFTIAALGAGAEMGPVPALLGWGATVAAVDLPTARLPGPGAGTLHRTGVDVVEAAPAVADWLATLPGRLVLGQYAYAPGGAHVLVNAAGDALARRLRRQRPDTALAYLATPTDVFAVPPEAVAGATAGFDARPAARRLLGRLTPLAQPSYAPGDDPGINDSLVPQQGPNYALAKRVQRWRATAARADGATVSLHVAPATRTRSVTANRALRAAYAGAHHYGVEVFEPATSSTLLAALLVHDLHVDPPARPHPWQDEAQAALHGGLWRTPYAPRSVLGLAAARGMLRR
jgi:hypothetical protein